MASPESFHADLPPPPKAIVFLTLLQAPASPAGMRCWGSSSILHAGLAVQPFLDHPPARPSRHSRALPVSHPGQLAALPAPRRPQWSRATSRQATDESSASTDTVGSCRASRAHLISEIKLSEPQMGTPGGTDLATVRDPLGCPGWGFIPSLLICSDLPQPPGPGLRTGCVVSLRYGWQMSTEHLWGRATQPLQNKNQKG